MQQPLCGEVAEERSADGVAAAAAAVDLREKPLEVLADDGADSLAIPSTESARRPRDGKIDDEIEGAVSVNEKPQARPEEVEPLGVGVDLDQRSGWHDPRDLLVDRDRVRVPWRTWTLGPPTRLPSDSRHETFRSTKM